MAHEQLLRLFIALELPDAARSALGKLQSRLEAQFTKTTYPAPDKLHITMHFLGETPVSRLPALIDALGAIDMEPATLRLEAFECFPEARRARVGVVSVGGELPAIERLHGAIGEVLRDVGYRLDHRKYRPHVTLARFKAPPRPDAITIAEESTLRVTEKLEPFRVSKFTLFESTLERTGSVYAVLGRFPRTQ
jgi:2'-5' RNA ligase